ncbi:MAG: SDR family NAD(P)-dependent oxidoreductase [Panacagrimonas sp.]
MPRTPKSAHDQGILKQFLGDVLRDRLASARRKKRLRKIDAMPDERQAAALIFGAGAMPGIGAAVAQRAAQGGYKVYLSGRNAEKLEATASSIRAAGGLAAALTVDVADPEQISAAFARVKADDCRLQLVVDNVGTNRPKPFLEITPELLEKCWVNDCRSGFLIGQHCVEFMLEQADNGNGRGTVLFTGASASLRGKAQFAAFAQAKAGLRMLAQAMAREYGPQGLHVAHIIIDGMVDGDRLRTIAPQYIQAQGEGGTLHPEAIAQAYWDIHQQHRSAWTHEVDLRPFKENW